MKQTWRWFGPHDSVSIDALLQSGVEGVVSALHHIPNGAVWTPEEISKRQAEIGRLADGRPSGLGWDVVESLVVSEDIKTQRGDYKTHFANYRTSIENLAAAGIEVICYNFMPVLDWTRTSLRWRLPHGGTCMRYDHVDFAAFDLFILERAGAEDNFPDEIVEAARERFAAMSDADKAALVNNVTCGLPGANENLDLDGVRNHLARYEDIDEDALRAHLIDFLSEVVPTAEKLGVRLCCHPDDPPFSLLGLPRIMSTETDYMHVVSAVDSTANGITLCSGSLGARPDNDLPGMMKRLGDKVNFLHLRNVKRDGDDLVGSFYEAEHLGGDTDMVALIAEVLSQEAKRRAEGRADHSIPMRPDHGQDILDDLGRQTQPGYPLIGRMRGLAELRGVATALAYQGS